MAGVKVTDLPSTASAASTDVMYIVDTGSNTSKQIEVGDLLDFESGTWTPTFSSFSGAITAATLTSATYLRVGNIVTCQINLFIDFDFTAPQTGGEFQFTYPIATTTANGGGSMSSSGITKQFNGSVRTNRIVMASEDTTLTGTGDTCHAIFQYEVN